MTKPPKNITALVFGDRVLDKYILTMPRRGGYQGSSADWAIQYDWQNHEQWREFEIQGGVDMTRSMLEWHGHVLQTIVSYPYLANGKLADLTLRSVAELGHCDSGAGPNLTKAFAEVGMEMDDSCLALRVKRYLGYEGTKPKEASYRKPAQLGEKIPNAIIINDAGTELRHSKDGPDNYFCELMTRLSKGGDLTSNVIMKMHLPLARDLAWEMFKKAESAKSRTLIVHADDLRMSGVPISPCPSWDRCADDVRRAWGLKNGVLHKLTAHCSALIILFDVEGALVLQKGEKDELDSWLVFDPKRPERDISNRLPGDIVGKMNCFLAHFTYDSQCLDTGKTVQSVERALVASRLFAESAYQVENRQLVFPPVGSWMDKGHSLRAKPRYQKVNISMSADTNLLDLMVTQRGTNFDNLARDIVVKGVKATLSDLPHGRFGDLWTVDVNEVEALRAVDQQIRSYLSDPSKNKPLSLAVFGPPGSGKSFGVKQLVDEKETPIRDYNLSQANADQLPTFFHEIRDLNLKGKTPLCFFDEFDSQNLTLLKYFLAPMQDGSFLESGAVRPLGRGIFVFAGGTASTMNMFAEHALPPSQPLTGQEVPAARETARSQKLPDFVSRLQGFIDVKGPNPIDPEISAKGPAKSFKERAKSDPAYILRRAILLRLFLEKYLNGIISQESNIASIESSLLTALLGVEDYIHGARSLELLIKSVAARPQMSSVSRSNLPIDSLISLYIHPLSAFKNQLLRRI